MLNDSGLKLLGAAAILFLAAPAVRAQSVAQFDLPPQPMATALRAIGSQTRTNVLFDPPVVEGLEAPALKAELTADQAFVRVLAGSGLKYRFLDDKTVMVTSATTSTQPAKPTASKKDEETKESTVETPVPKAFLSEVVVTGIKIDGLNNKGLLQNGDNGPLYHSVVTRQDIERMGVTTVEELFRRIPQTSSPMTALQAPVTNTQYSGFVGGKPSTMGLRGFASGQTVILVNGRALPRTGTNDDDGADLARIPLAAIERVEILPYAGSAIYGSGAIGGAINIILRKQYSGRDLDLYTGTTTDGGSTEYRMNYVDGRTFNDGRTNLTTTLSYQHRDPLYGRDRDYLDDALRRYGPNSGALTVSGQPAFEAFMLPALASAPGLVLINNVDPSAGLGIPGAPGARYATIPAGTSPAQSQTLTPSSFSATAGQFLNGDRYGRTVLYEPADDVTVNAQMGHDILKDRLSMYGEFTLSRNRKSYRFPASLALNLDADDPLNPFRNDVTPGFVGQPVTLLFDPVDVPDNLARLTYESARAVLGLKGKINEHWEWSADGAYDHTNDRSESVDTTTSITLLSAPDSPFNLPDAAPASQRRAIYPILADHRAFPNIAADTARFFADSQITRSHSRQVEGNARLTGELFQLPAGPLRISPLVKYQNWSIYLRSNTDLAPEGGALLGFDNRLYRADNSRSAWQGALEVSVPVIGKNWRPIPIESFEIEGSGSYETIKTVSNTDDKSLYTPLSFTRHANSKALAAKLQLIRDIAFRASYSDAFVPPNWVAVTQPRFDILINFPFLPDAARGNTIQDGTQFPWHLTGGGNLDLQPERANSHNFGVIFTPRFLPGFVMHVDYWKIEKTDAVSYPDLFAAFSNPALYSYAVVRAAPTPEEAARGWRGVITEFKTAPFNAASIKTEGVDIRLDQVLDTASAGTFSFSANASFTNNFELVVTSGLPGVDELGSGGTSPLKWRGNASVTWSGLEWTTTLTGRYVGSYHTAFTDPSPVYPNAIPLDGHDIPAYTRWDLQVGYAMPGSGGGVLNGLFSDTKWTLGVNNVFDQKPSFVTGLSSGAGGGAGFYNTFDDPRQRFVYFSVRKSF